MRLGRNVSGKTGQPIIDDSAQNGHSHQTLFSAQRRGWGLECSRASPVYSTPLLPLVNSIPIHVFVLLGNDLLILYK